MLRNFDILKKHRSLQHEAFYSEPRGAAAWLRFRGQEAQPYAESDEAAGRATARLLEQGLLDANDLVVVSLGPGGAEAEASVLSELLRKREGVQGRVRYVPVDASAPLLAYGNSLIASRFAAEIGSGILELCPINGDYEVPNTWMAALPEMQQDTSVLVLFLGNSVGQIPGRELDVIDGVLSAIERWADAQTPSGSQFRDTGRLCLLLGASVHSSERPVPHDGDIRSWLEFVARPLIDLISSNFPPQLWENHLRLAVAPHGEGQGGLDTHEERVLGHISDPSTDEQLIEVFSTCGDRRERDGIKGHVIEYKARVLTSDISLGLEKCLRRLGAPTEMYSPWLLREECVLKAGEIVRIVDVEQFDLETLGRAIERLRGLRHMPEAGARPSTEPSRSAYAVLAFATDTAADAHSRARPPTDENTRGH